MTYRRVPRVTEDELLLVELDDEELRAVEEDELLEEAADEELVAERVGEELLVAEAAEEDLVAEEVPAAADEVVLGDLVTVVDDEPDEFTRLRTIVLSRDVPDERVVSLREVPPVLRVAVDAAAPVLLLVTAAEPLLLLIVAPVLLTLLPAGAEVVRPWDVT